ncbi:MAG: hypothetical protein C0467_21255 [Planctomycetaceae bacterium]|nr:hypothetical protein [Planctomycetaceae bacterium]
MKAHSRSNGPAHETSLLIRVGLLAVGLALITSWSGSGAAQPAHPKFVVTAFDLGVVEQVRANEQNLATELTAQGWCTAQPKPKTATGWSDVPAGAEPDQWVSIVTVGFGSRAEAYAFQFSGPNRTARLLAHVPHRKHFVNGGERWFSPFTNLLDAFRIGHATAKKANPLPTLQLEVVLSNPKGAGTGGADEALTVPPEKVFPPVQVIATAAACAGGWAPTTQKADIRARVEVRVLDQACGFRVTFVRDGKETVFTRDRVPWEEYHDQLAMLLSLPITRPSVVDFVRPSPEKVELLAIESNRIICLVDDELTALDTATGAEAWRLRIPQGKTGPKRVERYATLHAAGKLRLFRTSTSLAEIAVADGAISPLAPTPATAFDVGNNGATAVVQGAKLSLVARGKEVWTTTEPEPIVAGPRLESDRVLIGTGSGELVALSSADKRELWRVSLGKRLWGPITPVGTLRLVFSAEVETLFAVDPKDGAVKWRFAAGDALVRSPFEYDGSVVVVTKANRIVRLDPSTGKVLNEVRWPTWVIAAELLTVGGKSRLAVGDVAGRLTLIDTDLKRTWESSLGARVTGRPVIAVTPPVWKTRSKPAKGGPDDLLDSIATDAAGTKPFLLTTDGAGFLYKLSTEGIK